MSTGSCGLPYTEAYLASIRYMGRLRIHAERMTHDTRPTVHTCRYAAAVASHRPTAEHTTTWGREHCVGEGTEAPAPPHGPSRPRARPLAAARAAAPGQARALQPRRRRRAPSGRRGIRPSRRRASAGTNGASPASRRVLTRLRRNQDVRCGDYCRDRYGRRK